MRIIPGAKHIMIQTLTVISYIPQFARWGLLVAICFLLYHHLSLPSLPWIAAQYAITFIFNLFAGHFFDFLRAYIHNTPHASVTLSYIGMAAFFLNSTIRLLIVLLIVSEISYFVSEHCPDIQSKLLTRFASVRKHVTPLGMALIALTLVKPVAWLVIWISHHPNTVA